MLVIDDSDDEPAMQIQEPPRKKQKESKAQAGRGVKEKAYPLVEARIKKYPDETLYDAGKDKLICQCCGVQIKTDGRCYNC